MSHASLNSQHEDPVLENSTSEENPHYVRPQFVIIDDRQKSKNDFFEKNTQEVKSPISLRFLCFLGLIFCSIFGLGMFLLSIVSTLIATGYLFRNTALNQSMRNSWKLSTHTLIAGLGFILGMISPTLGLGLIVLYFSVTGEIVDNHLLHSIIKRSFNKF